MSLTRVVAYLDEEILKSLHELYKDTEKPLSRIISELVEIGSKVKRLHEAGPESQEESVTSTNKHTEYLLKIMAIVADIYRCVRNGKSKYDEETTNDVLAVISSNAQNFVNRAIR